MQKGRVVFMGKSIKMFRFMVRQITKEAMMVLLLLAPFLAGTLFKFGIPMIEKNVCSYFGLTECISPYYDVFDWLLAILIGMLFAFVGGLVSLGEIDDRIALYYSVTPGGKLGYILSRIVYPGVLSGLAAFILVPLFSIGNLHLLPFFVMIISTVLSGIVTALLVVAISSNKVEGMAVGKLAGGFGAVIFIPLLVKGYMGYLFSPFPMYWIGKFTFEAANTWYLITALSLFVIWIVGLYKVFAKKL